MINFNEDKMRYLVGLLSQVRIGLTESPDGYNMGREILQELMKEIDELKPKESTEKK